MNIQVIEKIVAGCDGTPKALKEAVNRILLTEETVLKVGDTVAVVDDTVAVGGYVGKGKIKSFSEDKTWSEVELPGGSVTQVQTSLLYSVPLASSPA